MYLFITGIATVYTLGTPKILKVAGPRSKEGEQKKRGNFHETHDKAFSNL